MSEPPDNEPILSIVAEPLQAIENGSETNMKGAFEAIVGKTITGVIAKKGIGPDWVLILLFKDGSAFELYGDGYARGSSHLDTLDADAARRRRHSRHEIVVDL